jgi:hypothetical protein
VHTIEGKGCIVQRIVAIEAGPPLVTLTPCALAPSPTTTTTTNAHSIVPPPQ